MIRARVTGGKLLASVLSALLFIFGIMSLLGSVPSLGSFFTALFVIGPLVTWYLQWVRNWDIQPIQARLDTKTLGYLEFGKGGIKWIRSDSSRNN